LVYTDRNYVPSAAESQALGKLKDVMRTIPIPATVRFIKLQLGMNMLKGIGEAVFN
jgi:hypothetical protein